MAYIPNNWIQKNQDLLLFIFESKILKGTKDFCSLEKLLSELDKRQDANAQTHYPTETIRNLLQEMEHYNVIQLKKSSGVTYVTPTDKYFSLKTDLTKTATISNPKIQADNVTLDKTSSENPSVDPLQYIYQDITNNTGLSADTIQDLPKLIDLSIKILHDERSIWTTKAMISSCMGYLLIPNQTGSKDYIEELFLFSFTLKHIGIHSHYLLADNWDYPGISLKHLLDRCYLNSKIVLTDAERRDLLHLLGLPKLIRNPAQPVDFRKALGMIAYLMGEVYQQVPQKKTQEYLEKKLLSIGEYDEVVRILNIAKGELVPKARDENVDDILTEDEYDLLLDDLLLDDLLQDGDL